MQKNTPFFREDPEKYWDFSLLKNAPSFRDGPEESRATGLRSLLVSGFGPAAGSELPEPPPEHLSKKCKAEFFAYLGFPETPVPEGGFPGVVMIHGGGGTAFPSAAQYWIKHGYAVIALDWYNQYPVPYPEFDVEVRSPFEVAEEELPKILTFDKKPLPGGKRQDHVANVANVILAHSLLLAQPDVNPEKTAFVGLSWGSWYGAMVAAVDPRFRGGVEIYCGDIKKESDAFTNGRFHHAAKVPLYWITGTDDQHITLPGMKNAFEECPKVSNHTFVIQLSHSHEGYYLNACMRMADHFTQSKPGLPKLSEITANGNTVSAEILAPGNGIQWAELCYTEDTDPVPSKREWKHIPAKIEKNTISAELPAGAHQYFISAYEGKSNKNDLCGSTVPVILPIPE